MAIIKIPHGVEKKGIKVSFKGLLPRKSPCDCSKRSLSKCKVKVQTSKQQRSEIEDQLYKDEYDYCNNAFGAFLEVQSTGHKSGYWPCYRPGHFPYPWNCNYFVQCDDFGKAFLRPCAKGTLFDPRIGNCNHANMVNCNNWGWGLWGKYIIYNKCYKHGPGYYPDPYNCNKFIQCDNFGKGFHMTCPTGLHFNPKYSVCDWPRNVNCIYQHYGGYNYNPFYGPHYLSYKLCVKGYPGYKPHPKSCNKFIQCDNFGKAFVHACPVGLNFNPKNNVCDYPANVSCEGSYKDEIAEEEITEEMK
eukprot:gene19438-21363_t